MAPSYAQRRETASVGCNGLTEVFPPHELERTARASRNSRIQRHGGTAMTIMAQMAQALSELIAEHEYDDDTNRHSYVPDTFGIQLAREALERGERDGETE